VTDPFRPDIDDSPVHPSRASPPPARSSVPPAGAPVATSAPDSMRAALSEALAALELLAVGIEESPDPEVARHLQRAREILGTSTTGAGPSATSPPSSDPNDPGEVEEDVQRAMR
jgi:hypothetical protein